MRQLRPHADIGILDLHEIPDLDFFGKLRIRTDMDIGPHGHTIGDLAFMGIDKMRGHAAADHGILEAAVRPQHAVLADLRLSFDPCEGVDDGIPPDFYVRINEGRIRIHDGHAIRHQLLILATAQDLLCGGKLLA